MMHDPLVSLLQRSLGRLSVGTSVVASNLANVDTPGYRAREATFLEALDRAGGLEPVRTDDAHLPAAPGAGRDTPVIDEAPATRVRMDGNTVDVDREMTRLAALQGRFGATAQMVRKRFALWIYTVSNGRG